MPRKVSESVIGQLEEKPTKRERDAAFSSGAGRKAVEVPQQEQKSINRQCASEGTLSEEGIDRAELGTSAPVGLELETRSDNAMEGLYSE